MSLRVAFVQPPPLKSGMFIEAEDCCWGATGKHVVPTIMLSALSQMTDAHFIDLSMKKTAAKEMEALKRLKPDLLVYPVIWLLHSEIMEAMNSVMPRVPRIIIPFPFGYAGDIAMKHPRPFAVVNSEPEAVFAALDKYRGSLRGWREAATGITWCDRDGTLHNSAWLPNCIRDLEPTNYEAVPLHYWPRYSVVLIQVTRGCPYRCRFCVWGGSTCTDRTFRMKTPGQVARAMRDIRRVVTQAKGIPADTPEPIMLRLLSAQLTTNLKWIKRFHAMMHEKPYPFQANVCLRDITRQKLDLLVEAGMYAAAAGFEGLTDNAMRRMGKPHTFEEALRGALILEESGINYKLNFRYGYGETRGDVREALVNVQRLYDAGIRGPRSRLAPLVFYKGTVFGDDPPCETMQDPRFYVPVRCMKNYPVERWSQIGEMMTEQLGWKPP